MKTVFLKQSKDKAITTLILGQVPLLKTVQGKSMLKACL